MRSATPTCCGIACSRSWRRSSPTSTTDKLHIDAATLELVRRPHTFDVIVGSNLFGDILSDLTGGITGSLGLNPSANLNPERRSPSLFEPVHGSAPDIAGQGHRQPDRRHPERRDDARLARRGATPPPLVRDAVERALAAGAPDAGHRRHADHDAVHRRGSWSARLVTRDGRMVWRAGVPDCSPASSSPCSRRPRARPVTPGTTSRSSPR